MRLGMAALTAQTQSTHNNKNISMIQKLTYTGTTTLICVCDVLLFIDEREQEKH